MKGIGAKVKRSFAGLAERVGKAARWLAAGSAVTLAGLAAAFPSAGRLPPLLAPVLIAGVVALLAAPLVWLAGWALRLWGRFHEAEVVATDDGALEVRRSGEESVRRFAAGRLVSGMVVPKDNHVELRIRLDRGDMVFVRLDRVEDAERLLRQLMLGPGQKRLVFRWTRFAPAVLAAIGGYFATSLPLLVLTTGLEGTALHVPLAFLWLFMPYVIGGLAVRLVRRKVVAGTDGVDAKIGRRRVRFRYADVDGVEVTGEAIVFTVKGEPVRIPLDPDDRALGRAVAHRLERGWLAFRELVGSRGDTFRRAGRSFDEWKRWLAALLQREGGMREAPIRSEDAFRVLEDPEADVEARAGAALALAASGSETDARRVRVAVEATASERVRVVLEAAAEGRLEEPSLEELVARTGHDAEGRRERALD